MSGDAVRPGAFSRHVVTPGAIYPIAGGEPLPAGRTYADTAALATDERRPPRAGEWFLSGAVVEAYRARHNMATRCTIAVLVGARTTITWHRLNEKEVT